MTPSLKRVWLPEHAAHEQQVRRHIGRVEKGRAVRAHACQEGSSAAATVLRGSAQPQPPQVGTRPFAETQGWDELWSQGRFSFTGTPLLYNHWGHCEVQK